MGVARGLLRVGDRPTNQANLTQLEVPREGLPWPQLTVVPAKAVMTLFRGSINGKSELVHRASAGLYLQHLRGKEGHPKERRPQNWSQ